MRRWDVFLETVTTSRDAAQDVWELSGIRDDPPEGLLASITWESGEDEVTSLMLWATPGERGEFAAERVFPHFQSGRLGEQHGSPERRAIVHAYVRGA